MQHSYDRNNDDALLNGTNNYLKRATLSYILNFLDNVKANSPRASKYFRYVTEQLAYLFNADEYNKIAELQQEAKSKSQTDQQARENPGYKPKQQHFDRLKRLIEGKLESLPNEMPAGIRNVRGLSDYMGFDDLTRQAFEFIYVLNNEEILNELINDIAGQDYSLRSAVIASMTGNTGYGKAIGQICGTTGPLMESGFIISISGEVSKYKPVLSDSIIAPLEQPDVEMDALVAHLFPSQSDTGSALALEDFDDLRPQLDDLVDRIVDAVEKSEKGVNILLHGEPGVGKSELVEAIAAACNYRCISIGESELDEDPEYQEPEAKKRLSEAKRVNALARYINEAVIGKMDEAEDLLLKTGDSSKSADPQSKVQVNKLLENNVVPTIYTVNDISKFHPSFIQRFTTHMYVPERSIQQQAKIWSKMFNKYGVESVGADQTLGLARQFKLAPREIEKLGQLAAASREPLQAVRRQIGEKAHAARQNAQAYDRVNSVRPKFDPAFISAYEMSGDGDYNQRPDLEKLGQLVSQKQAFRALIAQNGGQGGTVFARYLAECGGMDTLEADGAALSESELMQPAEKKIAHAFAEAASIGAFLVVRNMQDFALEPDKGGTKWKNELATFAGHLKTHDLPVGLIMTDGPQWPSAYDHLLSRRFQMADLDAETARSAIAHYCDRNWSPESIELPDRDIRIGDIAKLGHKFALRPDCFKSATDLRDGLTAIIDKREQGYKLAPGFHKPQVPV